MLSDFPIAAAIPVSDLDRAMAFYRDRLGFEPTVVNREVGEASYDSGGTVFFLYTTPSAGTNQATAAAWRIDDLVATMDELRGRGVEFEEYDYPDLKTEDGIVVAADGTKVAWFRDSEGNTLALDQLPT